MTVDGVKCGPDGMRADVLGNLWCGSNAPLGYAGVLVYNPEGKLIGRIRLPEVCANLSFWRPQARPAFHGREPVALHAGSVDPGGGPRLTQGPRLAPAAVSAHAYSLTGPKG